jgi:hypothetical protein
MRPRADPATSPKSVVWAILVVGCYREPLHRGILFRVSQGVELARVTKSCCVIVDGPDLINE